MAKSTMMGLTTMNLRVIGKTTCAGQMDRSQVQPARTSIQ
jgi:hypothetical protein